MKNKPKKTSRGNHFPKSPFSTLWVPVHFDKQSIRQGQP